MEQCPSREGRSVECDRKRDRNIGRNVVAVVFYVCRSRDNGVTRRRGGSIGRTNRTRQDSRRRQKLENIIRRRSSDTCRFPHPPISSRTCETAARISKG